MINSSAEIMRNQKVIFDSLIACIGTTAELGGEGTRWYVHSISYLFWFYLFISFPMILLALSVLQTGYGKSPLALVNNMGLWGHLPGMSIDQILYVITASRYFSIHKLLYFSPVGSDMILIFT